MVPGLKSMKQIRLLVYNNFCVFDLLLLWSHELARSSNCIPCTQPSLHFSPAIFLIAGEKGLEYWVRVNVFCCNQFKYLPYLAYIYVHEVILTGVTNIFIL